MRLFFWSWEELRLLCGSASGSGSGYASGSASASGCGLASGSATAKASGSAKIQFLKKHENEFNFF